MKKEFLVLVTISLFLLIVDKSIGFGWARDVTQTIFAPIEMGLHEVGILTYRKIIFLTKLPKMYQENGQLKEEIDFLQNLIVENQRLESENKVLKEQLGVRVEGVEIKVFARILGEVISGEKVSVLINKGEIDGVFVDDTVVWRKFLVGRIVKVSHRQAEILPIFSNESKVPVQVSSVDKKSSGLVIGDFNSRVRLVEVLVEEGLAIGELVISSGAGGIYPYGLLIGRIQKIQKDENKFFQEAELDMFWNIKELESVFVLK